MGGSGRGGACRGGWLGHAELGPDAGRSVRAGDNFPSCPSHEKGL